MPVIIINRRYPSAIIAIIVTGQPDAGGDDHYGIRLTDVLSLVLRIGEPKTFLVVADPLCA